MRNAAIQKMFTKGQHFNEDECTLSVYLSLLVNDQDRIMITITIMTILATIQSSINKLVPKTAYLKMIDIWLIYSFNINILIMAFHIKVDGAIPRDGKSGLAFNPMLKRGPGGEEQA